MRMPLLSFSQDQFRHPVSSALIMAAYRSIYRAFIDACRSSGVSKYSFLATSRVALPSYLNEITAISLSHSMFM